MIKTIRKVDVIVIAIAIVVALAAMVAIYGADVKGDPVLHIYIDGDLIETYELYWDQTITVPVDTGIGSNTVVIENGMVYVEAADCPKQNCVHQGPISRAGEMIVCPPHRLVLRIQGVDPGEEDAS